MMKPPCRVQGLAAAGFCVVEYCRDCRLFHVTIGYTTLKVGPEAFLALGETLNTALARFRRLENTSCGDEAAETIHREQLLH